MVEAGLSLRELLDRATSRLAAAGAAEPRRMAVRLWAALTDRPTGAVLVGAGLDRELPESEAITRYLGAVERTAGGEPWQYAVGTVGFRRLTLTIDRRALIPRPETEELVSLVLERGGEGRVLDLGTGSGCIALALADEGCCAEVVGVDRSEDAIALARENAERTGLPVRFLAGSWCRPVASERFDLVVSNPPYIAEAELAGLDPLVREWEPREALDGGPDGLAAIRGLLAEVPDVLRPGGSLMLEVDAVRAAETAGLVRGAGFETVTIVRDAFGRDRFVVATRSES